jgi:hypothetical protein
MPEHALYYPEWNISDPVFLAECLLFWDRLVCMAPFADFQEQPWHDDEEVRRLMAEAHERYIFRFVPTEAQKQQAHQRIAAFAEHDPPDWCRPENLKPQQKQIFSAYKFAPETVDLLREKGWTRQFPRPNNLEIQLIADAAANLLLGALAEACSSPTLPPITDDPGSFSASCNLLLHQLGAPTGITTNAQKEQQAIVSEASDHLFLMTSIPRLGISPEAFRPALLRRILDNRDKPEIDGRRKTFQHKVDEYATQLRAVQGPERQLIVQEFEHELNADLTLLKQELQQAGLEALISKEGIVAVLLGLVVGAVQPGLGIAIGLAGEAVTYRQKRQDALDKHWSSWIFATTAPKFAPW